MDLGLDPVHGVGHQTNALFGVKSLDRLHEADVALLDQIGLRQAIAQVLPGNGHHQTQVGEDQLPGGIQVVLIPQAFGAVLLLLQREQGKAVDRGDVSI